MFCVLAGREGCFTQVAVMEEKLANELERRHAERIREAQIAAGC